MCFASITVGYAPSVFPPVEKLNTLDALSPLFEVATSSLQGVPNVILWPRSTGANISFVSEGCRSASCPSICICPLSATADLGQLLRSPVAW